MMQLPFHSHIRHTERPRRSRNPEAATDRLRTQRTSPTLGGYWTYSFSVSFQFSKQYSQKKTHQIWQGLLAHLSTARLGRSAFLLLLNRVYDGVLRIIHTEIVTFQFARQRRAPTRILHCIDNQSLGANSNFCKPPKPNPLTQIRVALASVPPLWPSSFALPLT